MSTENTGGPAFPCDRLPTADGRCITSDGMTLRDYFAAKAMSICPLSIPTDKAAWSYRMADAMLAARGK